MASAQQLSKYLSVMSDTRSFGRIRGGRHAAIVLSLMASMTGLPAAAQSAPPPPPPPPGGDGVAPPPGAAGLGISGQLAPLPPPSPEILAQYPPSTDPRNFEGIWLADQQVFMARITADPRNIPYTDAARAKLARQAQLQREADAQGLALLSDAGRCRPMGALSIGANLFPSEIIQGRDKVVILAEEGRGRWVIHLNEKAPPSNLKPTYFGHSVGHWEGNELVVETVGMRPTDGIFSVGMHTESARIVSRISKSKDGQRLTMRSTIYDPQTYTRPFETPEAASTWHPEMQLLEFQCEENREGAREGMVEIKE